MPIAATLRNINVRNLCIAEKYTVYNSVADSIWVYIQSFSRWWPPNLRNHAKFQDSLKFERPGAWVNCVSVGRRWITSVGSVFIRTCPPSRLSVLSGTSTVRVTSPPTTSSSWWTGYNNSSTYTGTAVFLHRSLASYAYVCLSVCRPPRCSETERPLVPVFY